MTYWGRYDLISEQINAERRLSEVSPLTLLVKFEAEGRYCFCCWCCCCRRRRCWCWFCVILITPIPHKVPPKSYCYHKGWWLRGGGGGAEDQGFVGYGLSRQNEPNTTKLSTKHKLNANILSKQRKIFQIISNKCSMSWRHILSNATIACCWDSNLKQFNDYVNANFLTIAP